VTVLRIRELSLSYQATPVFEDVSATLGAGNRIGIVGPNGSGKTSLLRVILGEIAPDRGTVDWVRKPRIGYVPQRPEFSESETPLDLIGYDRTPLLGQCGVGRGLWDQACRELSGGEKTRTLIAVALSSDAEVLILDEPTNHLDIPGIEWLEKTVRGFAGTVLAVSHDRVFLDAVSTGIWELRDRRLMTYSGGYSAYIRTVGQEQAARAREYAKWQRRVRELAAEVRDRRQWFEKAHDDAGKDDFLRRKAKKHARQFKAKEAVLEKTLAREPQVRRPDRGLAVSIAHAGHRTRTVLRTSDLGFWYEASSGTPAQGPVPGPAGPRPIRRIVDSATLSLGPKDKVGLIGPNGAGKTTLIRLLLGELQPKSGTVWRNPEVRIGHLSQMLAELDHGSSAAGNVSKATGLSVADARSLLGRMGITGDTQLEADGTLSMGERTRVAVCCLCFGAFDALVLDEPTNHLDVTARESVEQALSSFPGAIIVATHDRYLLDRVCNTIWSISGGGLAISKGNYSEFRGHGDRSPKADADSENADDAARRLALQADLAYLASKIAAARDAGVRADLELEYASVLGRLKALREKME
jgi:ATPase subunit of ABC transporter with duplicated ATPase domains